MRDIPMIGLVIAFGLISLANLNCTRPGTGDNIHWPAHLFKPFDALEVYSDQIGTVPVDFDGIWLEYSPAEQMITIIKHFQMTNDATGLRFDIQKNGRNLFYYGQAIDFTSEDEFFAYIRENPITLKDGETLTIKALNSSGGPVSAYAKIFGYTYPEARHPIEEKTVR